MSRAGARVSRAGARATFIVFGCALPALFILAFALMAARGHVPCPTCGSSVQPEALEPRPVVF